MENTNLNTEFSFASAYQMEVVPGRPPASGADLMLIQAGPAHAVTLCELTSGPALL